MTGNFGVRLLEHEILQFEFRAPRKSYRNYLRFPRAEQAAQKHKLSKVIGIVICDKESLAQNCLAGAMRNPGIQIRLRIRNQLLHRRHIAFDRRNALLPRCVTRGLFRFRPVPFRPARDTCLGSRLNSRISHSAIRICSRICHAV